MAIVETTLIGTRCNRDANGVRTYEKVYRVRTNSNDDDCITVQTATGLPSVYSAFTAGSDTDVYALLTSWSVERELSIDDTARIWRITCHYTTELQESINNSATNPLSKPPIITGGGNRRSKMAKTAIAVTPPNLHGGLKVGNLLAEAFDDVEQEITTPTLRIEKAYASINLNTFADYADSTNKTTFFGLGPRTWKLSYPTWRRAYWGVTPYYEVTFDFESRLETWDEEREQTGTFYLDAQGKVRQADDAAGMAVGGRIQLKADGTKTTLGVGQAPNVKFQIYKEREFANLGIPTSL